MAATPNWLLGKHLLSLDVYSGTRDTAGTITWATVSSSLLKRVDYVRVSDERMLEMIQSVDGIYAHYEKTLMDFSCTIGEILKRKAGSIVNILPALSQSTDLVKVVFTRGSAGTTETYTFLGTIRGFQDGVSAFGKNAAELTLAPIDDGTNSPLTYA